MAIKKIMRSLAGALVYFLVYIVCQFAVVFACLFIEALFEFSVGDMEMTAAAGILTLISYCAIFKARKKKFFYEIGLTRIPVSSCLLMVIFGAVLNVATIFVIALIPFPEAWLAQYKEMSSVITDSDMWLMILTSVIVAPVLEEVVFRGLVYTRLKRGIPMLAAMLFSAWVFGMVHGAIIWVIYTGVVGFLIVWVYEKYKSLLASICVHFGFNLCGVLLGMFESVHVLLYLGATLISVAIIFYVQLTSKNKIEFTMPKSVTEQTGGSEI